MSDFSVTFGRNLSKTRTNLVHDPAFTYRPTRSNGITPKCVGGSSPGSGWDSTRSKYGVWSYRTEPTTSLAGIWFERSTASFQLTPTTPLTNHTWSAWVQFDDDCDVVLYLEYYQDQYGYTYVDDVASSAFSLTGGKWTWISFTHSPPTNGNYVWLSVYKQGSATPIGMNVDGVVYETTPWTSNLPNGFIHPYFDGDYVPTYPPVNQTIEVEWNGTPAESTSTMTMTASEFTGDLLSVNISQGRRRVDEFATPGTCELELLNPTTIPEIGCPVWIYYGSETLFTGTVADTEMIFSMTDNVDVLRVSCESYLAQAGQAEITLTGTGNRSVNSVVDEACDAASLYSATSGMAGYSVAFDDYQGSCLSHLQRVQTTTFGVMYDASDYTIEMISGEQAFSSQIGGGFTDVLPTADGIVYSGIRFGSAADHFVTFVRLEPDRTGVDPVEIGEPPYSLVLSTYSPSTDAADRLATAYFQSFVSSEYSPHEITVDVAAQSNSKWVENLDLFQNTGFLHRRMSLAFRGTTYQTVVQGFTLTATPDSARVTYYLEPVSAYPFLRLDDSDVGILSVNVLGGGN